MHAARLRPRAAGNRGRRSGARNRDVAPMHCEKSLAQLRSRDALRAPDGVHDERARSKNGGGCMSFVLRPATRENTPLIVGIGGPTKSGKTYSAHRLAQGLADGGPVAMLNAEGARGHQYADKFKYLACDIEPPYSYGRYR